jgi:type II secretory pathway pseudopilin PulG
MKPRFSNQRNHALTITEVLVVVVMLSLLAAVALAQATNSAADSQRKACMNNLRVIYIANKVWAADNNNKFPAQVSERLGGAKEKAAKGIAFPIFQVMSNEMSTPKILVCPADVTRSAALSFTTGFDNSHVSYFVGLDADPGDARRLLFGDSNLAVDGKPAKRGLLLLTKNDPVTWTNERHINRGNVVTVASIVQSASGRFSLRQILAETGVATNRLAIP